jgi:hypothetical protein
MLSRFLVRRAAHSRRGVALVMFVMLVFAFFAIAGLAIDMGYASLTQQEMQVATDTAALEGVRLRNAYSEISNSDDHRREKVSHVVRLQFDDDMKPSGNAWAINDPEDNPADFDDADHMNMGAGPGMQMPGEVGNQHISMSSAVPVWDDPVLRYNPDNKRYGDMVSGTYRADAEHVELGDTYERPDFNSVESGTSDSHFQSLGFLVRMRRVSGISADGGQNPYDTEPYVSYRGRPVPFLFSIGSLIRSDGTTMDPRQAGITVRSTTIAVARPALRASAPPTAPDGTPIVAEAYPGFEHPMVGLYPFAMSLDYWVGRVIAGPNSSDPLATWHQYQTLQIQPDGTLFALDSTGMPLLDPAGQPLVVGRFAHVGTSVGQSVVPAMSSSIDQQPYGYVAIYTDIPSDTGSVSRVIGYGFCTAGPSTPPAADTMQFKSGIEFEDGGLDMSPVKAWVGPDGVSARLDADAPELTASEWTAVFERNHFLVYGPWTDTQGNTAGGEVTYDYEMIRRGSVLAATLAR